MPLVFTHSDAAGPAPLRAPLLSPVLGQGSEFRHGGRACPTCKAASATKDIAPLPRMVQNLVSALQVGELPLRVPIAVA